MSRSPFRAMCQVAGAFGLIAVAMYVALGALTGLPDSWRTFFAVLIAVAGGISAVAIAIMTPVLKVMDAMIANVPKNPHWPPMMTLVGPLILSLMGISILFTWFGPGDFRSVCTILFASIGIGLSVLIGAIGMNNVDNWQMHWTSAKARYQQQNVKKQLLFNLFGIIPIEDSWKNGLVFMVITMAGFWIVLILFVRLIEVR